MVFENAERYLLQGNEHFTFVHDLRKVSNGDFQRFGNLIALALINGCSGPRTLMSSVISCFLDSDCISPKLTDVPDLDVQGQLNAILDCDDMSSLDKMVSEFPERFEMGVTQFLWTLENKCKLVNDIVKHCCISSCLEEINEVKRGMDILGVLQVMKAHYEGTL